MSRLRAAVFDFGETVLSEERAWGVWADWIGATRQELFAALGATVEGRHPHRHALELCRPGFDLRRRSRSAVRPACRATRSSTTSTRMRMPRWRGCGRPVCASGSRATSRRARRRRSPTIVRPGDLVATSAAWDVSKPDPAFFARLLSELALPASAVAYVGDRVDNDVLPAAAAGLFTVHLRRGPWGVIQARLAGGGDGCRLGRRTSTRRSTRSSRPPDPPATRLALPLLPSARAEFRHPGIQDR